MASTEVQKQASKAAGAGNFARVKELLAGTDLVSDQDKLATQLRENAPYGDFDPQDRKSVELLYLNAARGAPIYTLLPPSAVRGGHVEILQYLFDRYPYPRDHLLDAIGEAIFYGSLDTVRVFIDRWPDIVHVPMCGSHAGTPLSIALRVDRRAAAYPMAELLLQSGADPNKASVSGLPMEDALTSSWPELVPLLIQHGAEPFSLDKELRLLPRAAGLGKLDVVSRLVEKGADLETNTLEGPYNGSPLCNAVRNGRVDVAEYLIRAGADPNQRNSFGDSMLQIAESLFFEKKEMVTGLRTYGAR